MEEKGSRASQEMHKMNHSTLCGCSPLVGVLSMHRPYWFLYPGQGREPRGFPQVLDSRQWTEVKPHSQAWVQAQADRYPLGHVTHIAVGGSRAMALSSFSLPISPQFAEQVCSACFGSA